MWSPHCGGRKVSILVFGPSHTISQLNFSLHKGWVGGPSAFCKRFPRLVHMVPQPIPKGNQDFAERCEILDKSLCMLHKIPTLRQINIVLSVYNCAVQVEKNTSDPDGHSDSTLEEKMYQLGPRLTKSTNDGLRSNCR